VIQLLRGVPSHPFVLALVALAACAAPADDLASERSSKPAEKSASDPSKAEVAVPALAGWRGSLVLDQGPVGVWTVMSMKVFPQFGCPEIVGIDDLGRCHVLWSYSGKWTPVTTIADGTWLGGLAMADVDPRIPGAELYTGSRSGNLYEVVAYRDARVDHRRVGSVGAREVHTILAGELDPRAAGEELLVFTSPGGLFRARPRADGLDGFEVELLEDLPGRIRDAVVLPADASGRSEVLTIGRDGCLRSLRITEQGPAWTTVHERAMGMGRIALGRCDGERAIVYAVCDDGLVFRHERAGGAWKSEMIYAGPQGMRGVAAGKFDADPNVETVAVFGYSKRVELLIRRGDRWEAETIFVDRDKGHWLCRAEVDGRNGTDELVATGYSGRIVLLSRPPGYGLDAPSAAVDSAEGFE
jgi:hypothetical protein